MSMQQPAAQQRENYSKHGADGAEETEVGERPQRTKSSSIIETHSPSHSTSPAHVRFNQCLRLLFTLDMFSWHSQLETAFLRQYSEPSLSPLNLGFLIKFEKIGSSYVNPEINFKFSSPAPPDGCFLHFQSGTALVKKVELHFHDLIILLSVVIVSSFNG